jgi:hypothetical protein
LTQHKLWADDLLRYGLIVVEIDDYSEAAGLMHEVERRVASNRVWISGSWPLVGGPAEQLSYVVETASAIGQLLEEQDFTLISGAGLVVGAASISGFLGALQRKGSWDLERRLIARPFPQPLQGAEPNLAQWEGLRTEMARTAGTVIFLVGAKWDGKQLVETGGVRAELEAAMTAGTFLLPVGCTGGTAKAIAEEMIDTSGTSLLKAAPRPSKTDLRMLMKAEEPKAVAQAVLSVLLKHAR